MMRQPFFPAFLLGSFYGLTLAASASAQGSPGERVIVRTDTIIDSIDVPDELVPAVMPYLHCVQAKAGVPTRSDGRELDLSLQPADCAPVRTKAVSDGVELLRRLGEEKDDAAREARVTKFLDAFESFSRPRTQEELEAAFWKQSARK